MSNHKVQCWMTATRRLLRLFFRCRHCRRLARLVHLPSASLACAPALPSGALLSLVMLLWLISFGKKGGGCDTHVNGGVVLEWLGVC